MRYNRTKLKVNNDSNAPEDPSPRPMVPSEATGSAKVKPNVSSRRDSRGWNGDNLMASRQALGEQRHDRLGEPTHSKSFSDGTLIETVRDPRRREAFRLLVFKNGEALIVNRFERDGDLFVPGEINHNLAHNLRLASGISPCGQPRELLAELVTTIRKYVDLPDDILQIIGAFVLCSWFPDRLHVAPLLWLVGPLSSGKTTILKLLQALCRRGFLVGDLTPASVYRLPSLLGPTLLIDENDLDDSSMSAVIRRLLRIGNTPGSLVIRNGRAFDPYCLKVLASRHLPSDAALASRSIVIGTTPSIRRLELLNEATIEGIALEFQPKLLMFRLQNFHNLSVSNDFSGRIENLTPRMRDIARGLAAPLLGDTELEANLIDVLHQQDQDARVQQSLEPEWLVVETLFGLCHDRIDPRNRLPGRTVAILVGGIAESVNQRMAERGGDSRLSAKKAGLILRALAIRTRSLGNKGRGIELNNTVREGVHKLSRQFGFDRRNLLTIGLFDAEYGGAACALCEKFGLTGGLKFLPERTPTGSIGVRRSLFEGEDSTTSSERS
jgi:hypothetical protein